MASRQISYMPLAEVEPAPRNPKRHSAEHLASSVQRFGYVEPMVLDERTGRLVVGHGRLEYLAAAAAVDEPPPDGVQIGENGEWLVPVVRGWESRDDAEAEAYLLASNRLVEAGGWDDAELAAMLDELSKEAGIEGLGFDPDDLAALIESLAEPDFEPESPDTQPRLDERSPIVCPHCGESFVPNQ